MDEAEVQLAFDDVFDHAVLFHGFTDYMRDYDIYVYIAPNAQPVGEKPQLRYRFMNCAEAKVRTTVRPDVWLSQRTTICSCHQTNTKSRQMPTFGGFGGTASTPAVAS